MKVERKDATRERDGNVERHFSSLLLRDRHDILLMKGYNTPVSRDESRSYSRW
jgi:hypothetical protein